MLELIVRQGTKSPKRKQSEDAKIVDRRNNIFIVADGIGGHPSSAKASQIASLSCYQRLKELISRTAVGNISDYIHQAMGYANSVLCSLSDSLAEFQDTQKKPGEIIRAGTTLDVCYFSNPTLYMGHIGDGRIYLLRNSQLQQLTEDHSSIQPTSEAVDKLKAYMGYDSLIRYIGYPSDFNPQQLSLDLQGGDLILMTTDGLTKRLFNEEIARILTRTRFNKSAKQLLKSTDEPKSLAKYFAQTREISYREALKQLPNSDDITLVLLKGKGVKNG